jgi:hypothetical protein
MKNTDPFVPTRRGLSPRRTITLVHVVLGLAVLLALGGLGTALWVDLAR